MANNYVETILEKVKGITLTEDIDVIEKDLAEVSQLVAAYRQETYEPTEDEIKDAERQKDLADIAINTLAVFEKDSKKLFDVTKKQSLFLQSVLSFNDENKLADIAIPEGKFMEEYKEAYDLLKDLKMYEIKFILGEIAKHIQNAGHTFLIKAKYEDVKKHIPFPKTQDSK